MARVVYKITCVGFFLMVLSAAYGSFLSLKGLLDASRLGISQNSRYAAYNPASSVGFLFTILGLAFFAPLAMRRMFPEVN